MWAERKPKRGGLGTAAWMQTYGETLCQPGNLQRRVEGGGQSWEWYRKYIKEGVKTDNWCQAGPTFGTVRPISGFTALFLNCLLSFLGDLREENTNICMKNHFQNVLSSAQTFTHICRVSNAESWLHSPSSDPGHRAGPSTSSHQQRRGTPHWILEIFEATPSFPSPSFPCSPSSSQLIPKYLKCEQLHLLK